MADIHGIPSESMMIPVQPFQSEPLEDLAAVTEAAGAAMDAGIVYPVSDRQREARAILESPQGTGALNVLSGDGSLGFPADLMPPDSVDNGGYGGA